MENVDLSPFFQTRKDAAVFAQGVTKLSESLYRTDFHLENMLLSIFGLKKKEAFLTLLQIQKVPLTNVDSLKDFLTKLLAYIQTLPLLSLTIAFEPHPETLETIAKWFVNQLKIQLLLEITVDPKILAGATMSYKGKFLDYSIKPVFDKIAEETLHPTQTSKPTVHQSTEHITLGR